MPDAPTNLNREISAQFVCTLAAASLYLTKTSPTIEELYDFRRDAYYIALFLEVLTRKSRTQGFTHSPCSLVPAANTHTQRRPSATSCNHRLVLPKVSQLDLRPRSGSQLDPDSPTMRNSSLSQVMFLCAPVCVCVLDM